MRVAWNIPQQWLADYYRLKRPALAAWREARLNSSKSLLCMLKIGQSGCMMICCRYSSERWPESSLQRTRGTFAFDPVVWDRKRRAAFDFSYRQAIPQRRNASMAIFSLLTSGN